MDEKKECTIDDIDLMPVILYIPKGAFEVELNCKINGGKYDGEKLSTRISAYELYDSIIDGEYYDAEHTKYVLNKDFFNGDDNK